MLRLESRPEDAVQFSDKPIQTERPPRADVRDRSPQRLRMEGGGDVRGDDIVNVRKIPRLLPVPENARPLPGGRAIDRGN